MRCSRDATKERCDYCGAANAERYTLLVYFFIRLCASCKERWMPGA